MTVEVCDKSNSYPNIAVIGGGTGLSTMLRGLKTHCCNITAIVTVADDGGGSGVLREDLGMLPPGDVRNCILALSNTEPILGELLNYRFKDGRLKGQNFGNLFLAADEWYFYKFSRCSTKYEFSSFCCRKSFTCNLRFC